MSDPNVYPLPANVPQYVPPPSAASGGIAQKIAQQVAASPGYQKLNPPNVPYDTRKAIISSFPGVASLIGASPEEVQDAQAWRKAHDAAQLAYQNEFIDKHPTYGKIVSGTEGAISGATLGAPEALQKVIGDQEATDFTAKLKHDYPIANLVGNIGGGVASSLAIPGAGEALAAKGGYLAAKGLLPLAARSALNAATFAVPTAVTQGIASGDPGKTWHDLKQNMLYGTIGGVALSKILGGAPKIANAMQDISDDMVLNAAGINSRMLKSVAGGGIAGKVGATAEKISNLKTDLADMISKNKLYGKSAIEDFTQGNGKIWDSVDQAFQQSGAKPSDYLDEIINHPDVQKLLNDPQYGQEVGNYIQNILQRGDALTDYASKQGDSALPDIRKILNTDMKNGFKSTDVGTQLKGDTADAIHDVIDGHFVPQDLKQAWPAMKLLKLASQRIESNLPKVEAGSATAPRMILEKMLGGGEGGAIAGAATGMQGFDPSDPSSWANMGIRVAAGTVLGSVANKGLARLANQFNGRTAGAFRGLVSKLGSGLSNEGGQEAASKIAEILGGGEANPLIPQVGNIARPSMPVGGAMSPQAQPAPVAPVAPQAPMPVLPQITPPQSAQAPPGAVSIQNAPGPVALVPIPPAAPQLTPQEQAQINFKQAGQPQPAAPSFNDKEIQGRLDEKYSRYVRQYGESISRKDYETAARRTTQDFDPSLPNTWKAMFDDPTTSDKLYKGYMNLQKIAEVDPGSALNHYTRFFHTGPRISSEAQKQEDQDNAKLVSALSDMTGQSAKMIDARLKQIAWDKGKTPQERQQEILDMIVKEGGVDVPLFSKLGLW